MTSELGNIVYEQVKQYIITELNEDGKTTTIPDQVSRLPSPPQHVTEGSEKVSADEKQTVDESSTADTKPVDDRTRRLRRLEEAHAQQVLFIVGKEELIIKNTGWNIAKKIFLSAFLWVRTTTNAKVTSMNLPTDKLIEVGFIREI